MPIRFPVEASHILMFARSLGETDAEILEGRVAPPTFAQAAAQFDPAYRNRPKPGAPWIGSGATPSGIGAGERPRPRLHAEQHFEYHRPMKAGDVLTVEERPGKTWEKASARAGRLLFEELISEYRDQAGELVVTARRIVMTPERAIDKAGS